MVLISKGRHGDNAIGEKSLPSSKLAMNDEGRPRIGKKVRNVDEFKGFSTERANDCASYWCRQ